MKNNKLIKKILKLKEDYTLNLEEGRDDEDLTVLRENITEAEYKNITETVKSYLIPKIVEAAKSIDVEKLLHKFVENYPKNKPGKHSLEKGKEYQGLKELYEGDFEKFQKDFMESFFKQKYNVTFKKCYHEARVKDKSNVPSFVKPIEDANVKGVQIRVMGGVKNLTEEFWEPFQQAMGGYFKDMLNEAKKVFSEESPKPEDENGAENDNPENPSEENVSEDSIIQELQPVYKNIGSYEPDTQLIPSFNIDESKINSLCEQHIHLVEKNKDKPAEVYRSFHTLLDKLVEAFKIEDNDQIKTALSSQVKNITDEDENSLEEGETINESLLREDDQEQAQSQDSEEGSSEDKNLQLSAKEEANKKIQELITNKNFDAVRNLLQGTNNFLPNALAILRLLVIHPDIFGHVGSYFVSDDSLRKDAKDVYAYYLLLILNEHFHAIFQAYDDDKRSVLATTGPLDPETAKSFLKKFRALVNNTKENAYSGALQAFISANDLTEQAAGYLMHIRSALTSTLKAVHDLVVADMKLNSNEELINWRKKDCRAAHEAFDTQLKASLEECFKKVLESTFTITTRKGEEVEVPIRNYMFDVEIPRRFKKALNVKNEQFEDFINKYYSEDVEKEVKTTAPRLEDYFKATAQKKQEKSLDYVKEEAQKVEEEILKEDEVNKTTFSDSLKIKPDQLDSDQPESEEQPEQENPPAPQEDQTSQGQENEGNE